MFTLLIKRGIIAVLFLVGLYTCYVFLTEFVKGMRGAKNSSIAGPGPQFKHNVGRFAR